jgi:hypothetical protein
MEKGIKLVDDVKSTDPRWPSPFYRTLIKFDHLERFIPTRRAKVLSAKVTLHYFDEWWSKSLYELAFERCLDGNKDHAAAQADGLAVVKGDKFPEGTKTPRPSYVTWDLNPETVQQWIEAPESNQGWVLRMKRHTTAPDDQGSGLWFHGFRWGVATERPKLTVRYVPLENVPPFSPTWATRFNQVRVGAGHVIRWTTPDPPDANGDTVHLEIEHAKGGGPWSSIATNLAGDTREYVWDTAKLPAEEGIRLRLRAVDDPGAASPWVVSDGSFAIVRGRVPFQIGIESPLAKVRREEPYGGPLGACASVELARDEYEGVQVILSGLAQDLKNVRVRAGDLKSDTGAGVLPASNISVNFVGYVHTKSTDKYSTEWAGLWPDPLLTVESVDVPVVGELVRRLQRRRLPPLPGTKPHLALVDSPRGATGRVRGLRILGHPESPCGHEERFRDRRGAQAAAGSRHPLPGGPDFHR